MVESIVIISTPPFGIDFGGALDDDLIKMYDDVQLGRGSTGRTIPDTLEEQLAMKEVLSNPLENAVRTPIEMGDSRWDSEEGQYLYTRRKC